MPISYTGISADLISTTLYESHDKVVDGLYQTTPFLDVSRKLKKVRTSDGGSFCVIPIRTEEQSRHTEHNSGWEPTQLSIKDTMVDAQYQWSRVTMPVSISGFQLATNQGRNAIVNLADQLRGQAIADLMRLINRQIVQGGQLTRLASLNGNTGYGGANTGFLEANAVGSQTNTVGGLARSSIVGLNNQWLSNGHDAATLLSNLDKLEARASTLRPPSGDGSRFHLALASMDAFAQYRALLGTRERFTSTDKMLDSAGIAGTAFSSGIMLPDRDIGFGRTDTDDENSFMLLNLDGIYLKIVSGQDFTFTGLNDLRGQYDGYTGDIVFQGALVAEHLGSQALMTDAV